MSVPSDSVRPQARIKATLPQALAILGPYLWHLLKEQILIVVPACLYLGFFQFTLFLEGVRIGLVPVGETIGDTLPRSCSLKTVLIFAFILGNLAAFGEPVIGSLQMAGQGIDPQKAPLPQL